MSYCTLLPVLSTKVGGNVLAVSRGPEINRSKGGMLWAGVHVECLLLPRTRTPDEERIEYLTAACRILRLFSS